ncbi:unnamed protein product [Alopecurus aequalis]
MPPRRHSSGYRGVRERPNGTFYAEIRNGNTRISLDTFETAHGAAQAWDAAAWRLGRPGAGLNFHDVWTRQQMQDLAPPQPLVTQEDERRNRLQNRRLVVTELDELATTEWHNHFLEDVAGERVLWEQRRAEKRARHDRAVADLEAANANPDAQEWTSDDPRLDDIWTTSDLKENQVGLCDQELGIIAFSNKDVE